MKTAQFNGHKLCNACSAVRFFKKATGQDLGKNDLGVYENAVEQYVAYRRAADPSLKDVPNEQIEGEIGVDDLADGSPLVSILVDFVNLKKETADPKAAAIPPDGTSR